MNLRTRAPSVGRGGRLVVIMLPDYTPVPAEGAQRLPLAALHAWEALGFGLFFHFGMSTFDGDELSRGDRPSTDYNPTRLDVDQWVQVARDAGARYAVLTAKHVAGHCLWPTSHNDYNVSTSSNRTDVVGAFVAACEKHGVRPGLYYCSWDNHNTFGSVTPSRTAWELAYTTQAYRDFQAAQIEELLTRYGKLVEVWIDIPGVLGAEGRRRQYDQIARLQPEALVMMNHGYGNGSSLKTHYAWPTDLMAIERDLPHSGHGYHPWHRLSLDGTLHSGKATVTRYEAAPAKDYYIPAEVCDPLGYEWFFRDHDRPRSDGELLGMRLICHARKANLLLNVAPDREGRLPELWTRSLLRLAKNFDRALTGW